MRIALCFFGITRNLQQNTLNSIETLLIRPLAEKDPTLRKFGHFNLVKYISNPRSGENMVPVEPEEFRLLNCDEVSHTDQSWLDDQLDYERIQKFGDCQGDQFCSLNNLVRQLYSLDRVTDILINTKERFDLVVYSRADLRFEKRIEIPAILPNTVYTPWFGKNRGLNDRFAMGDSSTMTKYGRRYSMMEQYCEETGLPLHGERFLLWYIRKKGIENADLTTIDFCRVRANGEAWVTDTSARLKLKYRMKRALDVFR
jgi:hypothetical protein